MAWPRWAVQQTGIAATSSLARRMASLLVATCSHMLQMLACVMSCLTNRGRGSLSVCEPRLLPITSNEETLPLRLQTKTSYIAFKDAAGPIFCSSTWSPGHHLASSLRATSCCLGHSPQYFLPKDGHQQPLQVFGILGGVFVYEGTQRVLEASGSSRKPSEQSRESFSENASNSREPLRTVGSVLKRSARCPKLGRRDKS